MAKCFFSKRLSWTWPIVLRGTDVLGDILEIGKGIRLTGATTNTFTLMLQVRWKPKKRISTPIMTTTTTRRRDTILIRIMNT
jgi:hypothetical protein